MNNLKMGVEFPQKVGIKYFGSIRVAARKSEEELEFSPNTTVFQLLQRLASIYGDSFRGEVLAAKGDVLRDDLMVTVNETVVKHSNTAKINLQPNDTLALFPIFPGGG